VSRFGPPKLVGPNNSYIATLVERHTRCVMLAKVAGKDTRTVVTGLIKQAKKLPRDATARPHLAKADTAFRLLPRMMRWVLLTQTGQDVRPNRERS
jgi:hypothetical protein